jgi:hypothetical protein
VLASHAEVDENDNHTAGSQPFCQRQIVRALAIIPGTALDVEQRGK